VIDLMDAQRDIVDMGGTMRLGAYYAVLAPGTKVYEAYGEPVVSERHRHRYEFNNSYRPSWPDCPWRSSPKPLRLLHASSASRRIP
jgi:CTP synthase (UTP-ammonia lyase)